MPREKKLRIVGIIETEPAAGFGGFGSGRLLIPLEVASSLRAAQVNDLRDAVRATNGKPVYAKPDGACEKRVTSSRDRDGDQEYGIRNVFSAGCVEEFGGVLQNFRHVALHFRQLGAGGGNAGNYQHVGDGNIWSGVAKLEF